jgi:hypothetical protein
VRDREHWTHFWTDYGIELQRRFFECMLKDGCSGWLDQPRVWLNIRRPGRANEQRGEPGWPLPDTQWTRRFLDPHELRLANEAPTTDASVTFDALGDGVRFSTEPLAEDTEITGPLSAKLFVSSSTVDADLFVVLHLVDPAGDEVTIQGSMDPRTCLGKGWLRASHRKLDSTLSTPYRPYHSHDEVMPLVPNEVYELDVEIWPTCVVVPAGYRIALSILGTDYFHPADDPDAEFDSFGQRGVRNGSGPIVHDDPSDRPPDVFGGRTTVHAGPSRPSAVLLPVIRREGTS